MPTDHLKLAFDKLDPNNLENGLPGREAHCTELYNFIYDKLKIRQTTAANGAQNRAGGNVALIKDRHCNKSFYICGVPGTGKTATTMSAIEKLKTLRKLKNSQISPFDVVYINAQHLSAPEKVYSEILRNLTGETCTPDRAQDKLEQIFKGGSGGESENGYENDENDEEDVGSRKRKSVAKKRKTTKKVRDNNFKIVVIDELDLLYNERRQSVLYSLFDWPTSADSKMILITIANAMDLAERFMHGKISSRMGWERLVFEPYTSDSLENILVNRLGKNLLTKCFSKPAIAMVTKRVGRSTGDARRILDTCRRALELAIEQEKEQVEAAILDRVGFQNLDFQRKNYITTCRPLQLLTLKAIVAEEARVGEENIDSYGVFRQLDNIMSRVEFLKDYVIGPGKFQKILNNLDCVGMIYLECDKPWLKKQLYLKDPSDDLKDLIKEAKVNM